MDRKRLIVIGGGFGGLNLVRSLKKAPLDILLIDKHNHHLFQPLLYQAATATLSPRDICVSFREIFARQKNTQVIMGEVVKIDKEHKYIFLGNGDFYTYDYLVIAIGSRHSYFGNDRFAPFAPGLKTITDALDIRERILTAFEKAERLDSVLETDKFLTFVIIGAGPTGVELAGTLAELVNKTLKKNFRKIRPEQAKIYLIEGLTRVLPPFHPTLSARAHKYLEKMGVTVILNKLVTDINENGVQLGDAFIEAKTVLWAAGNMIPPLVKTLGVELDKQGRVIVEKDLSLKDHPEIFVIGDAAHLETSKGKLLPGVATVALQEGRFLGKLLKKEIKKRSTPHHRRMHFKYFDKGNLATIGTGKAVGSIRKLLLTGFVAWILWAIIHIAYLVNFRNRLSVMFEWFLHHITGVRTARIIHGTIDEKLPKRDS